MGRGTLDPECIGSVSGGRIGGGGFGAGDVLLLGLLAPWRRMIPMCNDSEAWKSTIRATRSAQVSRMPWR